VTAETVATYYAVAQKMIETKAVPPVTVQVENGAKPIDGSLFGTGKAAFHLLFHTQVQAFASAAKTDLTLLRLPAITSGNSMMANKASMYWSISAKTKYPEAAARFVDFLVNDPDAAKILLIERGVPAIPAIQKEVAPLLDATGKVSLTFAQAMQAEVKAPPQVTPPTASKFGSEFTRLSQDVLFGRARRPRTRPSRWRSSPATSTSSRVAPGVTRSVRRERPGCGTLVDGFRHSPVTPSIASRSRSR
jgi:multiple sugar transport system substrate-binding protein